MKRFVLFLTVASIAAGFQYQSPAQHEGGMRGGDRSTQFQQTRGSLTAQGRIEGTVHESESGLPIEFATVALWRNSDKRLVTGSVTDKEGKFSISGLGKGSYYLDISFVGYDKVRFDSLEIGGISSRIDVGTVSLTANAEILSEIQVTAERDFMTVAIDKIVYNTREMPIAAGGSVTDLLQNIPSVEVDIDGNINLRGSQNVAIMINSRPTPLRGQDLSALLEQYPADAIERIEVIPNPSARYDPEGMAGIIDIIMRKDTNLGLNVSLRGSVASGDKYNGSLITNYQKGKLNLFTNYSYRLNNSFNENLNFRENSFYLPVTFLDQYGRSDSERESHMLNASLDYYPNPKTTVTISAFGSMNTGMNRGYTDYDVLDDAQILTRSYTRNTVSDSDGSNAEMALSFRRTFSNASHELKASARYNTNDNNNLNNYDQEYFDALGNPDDLYETLLENTLQDNRYDTAELQVDYVHPVSEEARFETGYKSSWRTTNSTFHADVFDSVADEFLPDVTRNNAFIYNEGVHAAYAIYGQSFGAISTQVGLRAEQVYTDFNLDTTGETYDNSYFSLYPSAFLRYEFDKENSVRASYSRRVNRPRTFALNPFTSYDDPLNIFRGNPFLKPEYTDSYELNFTRFSNAGTVTVSPFFRKTTDGVGRYKTVVGDTSITTFENFGTDQSYGLDLNVGLFPLPYLNLNAGLSGFQQVIDATNVEDGLTTDTFSWRARLSATMNITDDLALQFFMMYSPPRDVPQGRMSGMSFANIALRQRLWDNRGSLSLNVRDAFATSNFNFTSFGDGYYQESSRIRETQIVTLSFQYSFGEMTRRNLNNGGDDDIRGGGMEDVGID